jgi:protein translocase SecG subunit
MNLALGLITALLVFLCIFLCFLILLQRPRQDSGMGAALGGGGFAESAFGAESGTILTKATVWLSSIFFVVGFLLYIGYLHQDRRAQEDARRLPTFEVPASTETTPATPDASMGTPITVEPVVPAPAEATPAAPAAETPAAPAGTAPAPAPAASQPNP